MADIKSEPTLQTEVPPQSSVEQFLEKNFRAIMIGLAGLAVVLLAFAFARYYTGKTAQEAAMRFTSAITTEDCDLVVQKYPGSVAAGDALMRKSELLWNDGKKESSVGALRQFEKDYGSHPMRPAALFGLATKLVSMGEKAPAREVLNGILNKFPKSEFAPAAQIQLGDMLWEEGKTDEAKKLFESLGRLYPGKMTALMDLVDRRIKLIDSGLPTKEVEPPPAPKPSTPPVPAKLPGAPGAATMPKPMALPQITAPTLTPPSAPSPAASLPVPPLPSPVPAPAKPVTPQSSATIPVPTPAPAPKAPAAPTSAATPPVAVPPPTPASSNPKNLPVPPPPPPPVKSNP